MVAKLFSVVAKLFSVMSKLFSVVSKFLSVVSKFLSMVSKLFSMVSKLFLVASVVSTSNIGIVVCWVVVGIGDSVWIVGVKVRNMNWVVRSDIASVMFKDRCMMHWTIVVSWTIVEHSSIVMSVVCICVIILVTVLLIHVTISIVAIVGEVLSVEVLGSVLLRVSMLKHSEIIWAVVRVPVSMRSMVSMFSMLCMLMPVSVWVPVMDSSVYIFDFTIVMFDSMAGLCLNRMVEFVVFVLDISSEVLTMVEFNIVGVEILVVFLIHIMMVEATMMGIPEVVGCFLIVMRVWKWASTD